MRHIYEIMRVVDDSNMRVHPFGRLWTNDFFNEITELLDSGAKFVEKGHRVVQRIIPIQNDHRCDQC